MGYFQGIVNLSSFSLRIEFTVAGSLGVAWQPVEAALKRRGLAVVLAEFPVLFPLGPG
jgi:hypothetical protein